jgi:LysR family transcriptional regulator, low CO2-responsive transcriptional regulator
VAVDAPPPDLHATPLRNVGQLVVVPESHRLAKRRSLKAADLDGEPLIVAPVGRPHRAMLQQLFRSADAALHVAVEATGWELILQFARYRVGLAVVNDFCAVPHGMVGIPLSGAPKLTYYLLSRGGFTTPGADALRRLIVDTAK